MERIAVILGKMHSGGKKNLVMEYYRHIDRTKIQFDFLCDMDSNAIPKEEIESLGGRVYEISPYQNIFYNLKDIREICKANNYKIMHGYNGTMNVVAMLAGWQSGVPIRINESISMAHNADRKTIIKRILKPFSRCFSTNYMSNGEACGRWQFGDKLYDKGKVEVFKTVIDTEKNNFNLELRERTRKELLIEDNIVIGHIGRLTAQKNTLFLIDIFEEIKKLEDRAKLLIIGDGDLKGALLNKISAMDLENEVIYLGRREDIQQFYNAMDCFILPSLYEGLPVVGVEAETCGLPVFFSAEIPRESNVCSDLGFFLSLGFTKKEWAEKILHETKCSMRQRRGRMEEVLASGFDSKTEAGKLLDYYYNLLKNISKKKNKK